MNGGPINLKPINSHKIVSCIWTLHDISIKGFHNVMIRKFSELLKEDHKAHNIHIHKKVNPVIPV